MTCAQAHRPFLPAHLYPSGLSMTMDEQMNAIRPSSEVKTNTQEGPHSSFLLRTPLQPNRTKTHLTVPSRFSSPVCLLFLPPWALATGEKPSLQEGAGVPLWLTTHSPLGCTLRGLGPLPPHPVGFGTSWGELNHPEKTRRGGQAGAAAAASLFSALSSVRF